MEPRADMIQNAVCFADKGYYQRDWSRKAGPGKECRCLPPQTSQVLQRVGGVVAGVVDTSG
jgi:hypothetical protein